LLLRIFEKARAPPVAMTGTSVFIVIADGDADFGYSKDETQTRTPLERR
jgi:hypothetical protein